MQRRRSSVVTVEIRRSCNAKSAVPSRQFRRCLFPTVWKLFLTHTVGIVWVCVCSKPLPIAIIYLISLSWVCRHCFVLTNLSAIRKHCLQNKRVCHHIRKRWQYPAHTTRCIQGLSQNYATLVYRWTSEAPLRRGSKRMQPSTNVSLCNGLLPRSCCAVRFKM